jgi:PTH2 family peptidyl-tRNA hydrolase
MKQAIIVRKDLKMSCGKIAGQVAHASVRAMINAPDINVERWFENIETKVVLKVYSEEELWDLATICIDSGVPCSLVRDAGKTQLEPDTLTALGIGPDNDDIINEITKGLKLL